MCPIGPLPVTPPEHWDYKYANIHAWTFHEIWEAQKRLAVCGISASCSVRTLALFSKVTNILITCGVRSRGSEGKEGALSMVTQGGLWF